MLYNIYFYWENLVRLCLNYYRLSSPCHLLCQFWINKTNMIIIHLHTYTYICTCLLLPIEEWIGQRRKILSFFVYPEKAKIQTEAWRRPIVGISVYHPYTVGRRVILPGNNRMFYLLTGQICRVWHKLSIHMKRKEWYASFLYERFMLYDLRACHIAESIKDCFSRVWCEKLKLRKTKCPHLRIVFMPFDDICIIRWSQSQGWFTFYALKTDIL